jgi:hypothetical protein
MKKLLIAASLAALIPAANAKAGYSTYDRRVWWPL